MNNKTRENGEFQWTGWIVGSVSLALLVSAVALALFARQAHVQVSVATIILALYLASWSYVLGLGGLLFLSGQDIRVQLFRVPGGTKRLGPHPLRQTVDDAQFWIHGPVRLGVLCPA
jgi:hypothetical protein